VLRAVRKEPESLQAILDEIGQAKGAHPLLDSAIKQLPDMFQDTDTMEYRARRITEKLALGLQASILVQNGNALISDSFIQARLGDGSGHVYGMLPTGIDCKAIIERARLEG
jgi:putative acyl-CoA dehydrogenase